MKKIQNMKMKKNGIFFVVDTYKLDLEEEKEKLKPNGERNGQQCCLSIIMMI